MRNFKQILPMALLCALALFSFACGDRQEPEDELVSQTQPSEEAAASIPTDDNELQPDVVTIDEDGQAGSLAELEARERRLAERQAELDAREERLRDREARPEPERPARRAEAPKPAPASEPEREARAEPTPAPEPEARAEVPETTPETSMPEPEEPLEPERAVASRVAVPAGTQIDVQLSGSLSSETSSVGDMFRARVVSDVVEDGEVVIPSGSEIVGEVTQVVASRKIGGQARLGLRFTDLVLPSGSTVPIDATLEQLGRSQTGKDAATIGGAAAGGAILGRVLSKKDRGAVIGAIIGAAAGAAAASRNASDEVVIPEGTPVSLSLSREIEVPVRR